MKLKDKVALITGGARGIGKAVALAYAREGARLAICARTESELNETGSRDSKIESKRQRLVLRCLHRGFGESFCRRCYKRVRAHRRVGE